jgi:hypothetical protein
MVASIDMLHFVNLDWIDFVSAGTKPQPINFAICAVSQVLHPPFYLTAFQSRITYFV